MKNNEILISVRFESGDKGRTMSFLVIKDISLRVLIQGLYYGLKKLRSDCHDLSELSDADCFRLFDEYIRSHDTLLVFYTIMGRFDQIRITDSVADPLDNDKIKKVYDLSLSSLGIVTSSQILITDKDIVPEVRALFDDQDRAKTYILRDNKTLEYNISSRRLNVIEPTVIDILPAGDMPEDKKNSFLDVLIPPFISAAGMFGVRFVISKLTSSTAMNDSMMAMTVAMPLVSAVNSMYNFRKQGRDLKKGVGEWKTNYENYISRIIERITKWQRDEITYLNSVYPGMNDLFEKVSGIAPSIFSRSQNDNDFMRISLGISDEIKSLFEINAERKDEIFNDVYYRLETPEEGLPHIVIDIPGKKNKKLKVKETQKESRNRFLLTDLPYVFANSQENDGEITGFKYMRDPITNKKPPLLIDLRNMGTLGIISSDPVISHKFLKHIVFELAYYHSPEDLQMVFLFDKENNLDRQNDIVSDYMFLPHTNELFDNISQFVFDKQSAGDVFSQLQSIMAERKKNAAGDDDKDSEPEKLTQIVCFVLCDYDIKESAFSRFIPEAPKEGEEYVNSLGLTFVFICREEGMLPKFCGSIVDLNRDQRKISNRYNVLSHETLSRLTDDSAKKDGAATTDNIIEYTHFDNDYIYADGSRQHPVSDFTLAFRRLSSIYYTRIAENGKVPSMVTLFELCQDVYNIDHRSVENGGLVGVIENNWNNVRKNDVTRDLKIAMGKNEHGITYLDLHENADGPHMLVAGTTGSGKSETIITYLIGLCMKYSPMDLNLMLVDMKGGGFSDRLGSLPHCVGTVTNTAGESEGISAVYMLKRFLESLNAEIKKREIILSELGVDNTDAYIRVLRKIKRIHELDGDPNGQQERNELIKGIRDGNNQKQIQYIDGDISRLKPLSHLILVVDEFTELKRFSSEADDVDFIAEITTIARVGRTLGLHIILVSQNIEGAINDDIRVNTKSKICLKVATKQASKEMLGTTDAAAATMPGHGRAYILVGTGSRYEYFQSAYTGANRNVNIEPTVNMTFVSDTGRFNDKFYVSNKDNEIIRKKNKQVNSENTQLKYIVGIIGELSSKYECPQDIFQDPLRSKIYDNDSINPWEGVNADE